MNGYERILYNKEKPWKSNEMSGAAARTGILIKTKAINRVIRMAYGVNKN